MILIAHRGNVQGSRPELENTQGYLLSALNKGFDVETDVWRDSGTWKLGHDAPVTPVGEDFLCKNGLWCHAKNREALSALKDLNVHCFWHENDTYTLTSRGFIWCYSSAEIYTQGISVLPENFDLGKNDLKDVVGICSDVIAEFL